MDDIRGIEHNQQEDNLSKLKRERVQEILRREAQQSAMFQLLEGLGVRDSRLVLQLTQAGFDVHTSRLLYLVPAIEVAWSDGTVTRREALEMDRIAGLQGISIGSEAHKRLKEWLDQRPSDRFFQACRRGIKLILQDLSPVGAVSLRRDLIRHCTRVAAASGGVSREEQQVLSELATGLEEH